MKLYPVCGSGRGAGGADQAGGGLDRQFIAAAAEARNDSGSDERHVGFPAKRLPRRRVRQVAFDDRYIESLQRVEQGHGSVTIARRVDDQRRRLGPGLLHPVDQLALVVGLPEQNRAAEAFRPGFAAGLDISQRLSSVDLRLAGPQQAEVWSAQHMDRFRHQAPPSFRRPLYLLWAGVTSAASCASISMARRGCSNRWPMSPSWWPPLVWKPARRS